MGTSTVSLNDPNWYHESMLIHVNRIGVLSIVGGLELALRHPDMPKTTRCQLIIVGKALALALLADGIILPDEILKGWEEAFDVELKPFMLSDLDAVYVGENGRPWK